MTRKQISLVLLGTALALAGILAGVWLYLDHRLHQAFKGYPDKQIFLIVERGESADEIGRKLESKGIIESSALFRLHLRLQGSDFTLKAGEYRFSRPLSLVQVAEKLQQGEIFYHKMTVPEGLDRWQTAKLLARSGYGDPQKLEALIDDPTPIRDLDPQAQDLEGYLFPDTYYFPRQTSEQDVILEMVEGFRSVWNNPSWKEQASRLGWSLRQVVTMASLIEKETAKAQERPLVSSVFHNRIQRQMLLACDPTVIYAVKRIKEYDGIIHRSDLQLDSPYNTYIYPGLPPGPIANPGRASLEAALFPAETSYLFFVSRNDGSHIFSENYRDHDRAVQMYQRR